MKNILKSFVALSLLFVTTTGLANKPEISLTTASDSKSLVVALEEQTLASKIELTNANKQIIYSENIAKNNCSKKFNLKDLRAGTYFFSIENAISSVVYTLKINQNKVEIANKEKSSIVPVIRKSNKKVTINLYNPDQKRVHILITDSSDRVVYKESTSGKLTIEKAFNFEKAVKDRYTIKVIDGKKTYKKSITIE